MCNTREIIPLACVLGSSVATAADAAETLTHSPLDWLERPIASLTVVSEPLTPIRRLPGHGNNVSDMSIHSDLNDKRSACELQTPPKLLVINASTMGERSIDHPTSQRCSTQTP